MIIGTFASLTTGATAIAFGVRPKPAELHLIASDQLLRQALRNFGRPLEAG